MEETVSLDHLPEGCIAHVLSFTSPRDACQSSLLSSVVRDAAESDTLWEIFLPANYREIISRLVSPVEFTSKKELFFRLCSPLLIDDGKKYICLDKSTGKICYLLSARELSIAWADYPLYWCWKPFQSRFNNEVVELVMTHFLEIHGKMNTTMLSPNTIYGVYLIVKIACRAYGLDFLPSEVSVEVGDYQSRGTIYLRHHNEVSKLNGIGGLRSNVFGGDERLPRERNDGWLEIELGEFCNNGADQEEVRMSLKEIKGEHLKGGLIVEGIEFRPK